MKKIYVIPAMEVVEVKPMTLLSGSGVVGDNGIPFGGIDVDGTVTPGSRELENVLGLPGFVFE